MLPDLSFASPGRFWLLVVLAGAALMVLLVR